MKQLLILGCLLSALGVSNITTPLLSDDGPALTPKLAFWRLKSVTIIHPGTPQPPPNAAKQVAKPSNSSPAENTTNSYLSPYAYPTGYATPAGYYGLPRVRNFSETNPIQYRINPNPNGNLPSDPVHNLRLN
ncbi:MAG: hypothetical protein K2X01_04055 [Cyanobacteria bacterium]|nr:hypothetical protein [Cyanobacteriota bacterium]